MKSNIRAEHKTGEYWSKPENLKKIEEWSRKGLIISDLAHNMGIAKSTLHYMKNDYPEIDAAYRRGKEVADLVVVNAYYKLASGYVTEEETKELNEYGELVTTKVVKKEVAPNEKAASTWIKNRMPGFMRDNQLTDSYKAKLEAETKLIEAKVKLLEGGAKDSSHLNSLVSLLDELKTD